MTKEEDALMWSKMLSEGIKIDRKTFDARMHKGTFKLELESSIRDLGYLVEWSESGSSLWLEIRKKMKKGIFRDDIHTLGNLWIHNDVRHARRWENWFFECEGEDLEEVKKVAANLFLKYKIPIQIEAR